MRLLNQANPNETIIDKELCRHFPIALTAAIEGYFKQAIADLTNLGEPYESRVKAAIKRRPKIEVYTAIESGEITIGDWYAHITSFGSMHEIDNVLTDILAFPFLDRLLNSEFKGFFDDENFHLREFQQELVDAVAELFQTRHMLCHEFAPTILPDIATLLRMITVADILVSLSEIIIFAEAEQGKVGTAN